MDAGEFPKIGRDVLVRSVSGGESKNLDGHILGSEPGLARKSGLGSHADDSIEPFVFGPFRFGQGLSPLVDKNVACSAGGLSAAFVADIFSGFDEDVENSCSAFGFFGLSRGHDGDDRHFRLLFEFSVCV